MFDIVLLGLNHKTSPVALRELLAFSKEDFGGFAKVSGY
jgi:glutamyl-tRNA reductase